VLWGYAHASPQNCLFLTLSWNLIPAQSCGRFLPLYSLLGWRTSLQRLKVAAHVFVMVVSVASDWWVGDGIFAAPLRFRTSSLGLPEFLSGPAVPFGTAANNLIDLHGSDDRDKTCLWIFVDFCGPFLSTVASVSPACSMAH